MSAVLKQKKWVFNFWKKIKSYDFRKCLWYLYGNFCRLMYIATLFVSECVLEAFRIYFLPSVCSNQYSPWSFDSMMPSIHLLFNNGIIRSDKYVSCGAHDRTGLINTTTHEERHYFMIIWLRGFSNHCPEGNIKSYHCRLAFWCCE